MEPRFDVSMDVDVSPQPLAAVDLMWIPLGAGQRVVQVSGRTFEALSAAVHRRRTCDLYHSALSIVVPEGDYVIEMAPIPDIHGERRGVVAEGPVAMRFAGRFRVFRYEIRRWKEGVIPDASEATSTVRVSVDPTVARRLLDVVASVPTPVWGRDELDTGDMWNSNSVVSWLLTRGEIDTVHIAPPPGGRAPGWNAGLVVARRQTDVAVESVAARLGAVGLGADFQLHAVGVAEEE